MANAVFFQQPPTGHDFVNVNTVIIDHNLGYVPNTTIVIGGYVVTANVQHPTANRVVITFHNSVTGTVYLR